MLRTRLSSKLASLLLIVGTGALPCAAQETTPNPSTPTDTRQLRKLGKMDVRHPLHVGSDYYPKKSLQNHEQGTCVLSFYIEADGSVPAAQLLISTGFPRLDTACFESVIGVPLIPATINGTPVAGWGDFTIVWSIGPRQFARHPPLEKTAVPRIANDYALQVGDKIYPEAARAKHQKGYCMSIPRSVRVAQRSTRRSPAPPAPRFWIRHA